MIFVVPDVRHGDNGPGAFVVEQTGNHVSSPFERDASR